MSAPQPPPLVAALQAEAAAISGAAVYLDDAAADAIALSFGTDAFLDLMPAAVLPLGATRPSAPIGTARALVFVGEPMELHADAIEAVLVLQQWEDCLVLSALPADLHDGALPLSGFAARFRAKLGGGGRIEVRQLAALAAAALPGGRAFALPGCENTHGLQLPTNHAAAEREAGRVAGCIDALLHALDLSLPASRDVAGVFVASSVTAEPSAPTLATRVAQRLADRGCAATSHRQGRAAGSGGDGSASTGTPVSVVVVDRVLDLVGSASAGGGVRGGRGDERGCALDRLLSTLPRKRPHSNQLHIPMGALDDQPGSESGSASSSALIPDWMPGPNGVPAALGGSLYHPTDSTSRQVLASLVLDTEKTACLTLQRALINAISDEQVEGGVAVEGDDGVGLGVVNVTQLRSLVRKIAVARPVAYRHTALLELSAAMLTAMKSEDTATKLGLTAATGDGGSSIVLDNGPQLRAELERLVLATVSDPEQAFELLPMISELLGTRGRSEQGDVVVDDSLSMSLPELVLALVFVYSARGPPLPSATAARTGSSPFRQEDEFAVLDRVRASVMVNADLAAAIPNAAPAFQFEMGTPLPGWEDLLSSYQTHRGIAGNGGSGDVDGTTNKCTATAAKCPEDDANTTESSAASKKKWADLLTEILHSKLLALSWARMNCPVWHTLVSTSNKYVPLVGQIARDIADGVANADDAAPQPPATPAGLLRVKPSVASVAAAGLTGGAAGASGAAASLFKGGLSRLGFVQTTPKPSDNNVVLLVVAGPVTPFELRRVAEVAEQTGKTLLLAGTRLSSPDEFLGDFLASS